MNRTLNILRYACLALLIIVVSCKKPQGFEFKGIKNLQIGNANLQAAQLSMDIDYYNPNNYAVDVRHVEADIFINQQLIGNYRLDTVMHVNKLENFTMPTKVTVNIANILNNSLSLLFNNEYQVNIKGKTRVGKAGFFITIPFSYEGKQSLQLFQ